MKNALIRNILGLVVVVMLGSVAFGQAPKRIDFAKEGPSLVWEERVEANSSKDFVFYAKKGQKLSISFIDDTKKGSMDLGKVSIEPNEDPYEEIISVAKDYRLTVSNNSNKFTSFRIAISLETPAPVTTAASDTERIVFPKGSIEVNLERIIPAGGTTTFLARAVKGQTVAVKVTPKRKNISLDVVVSEKAIKLGESYEFVAPKNGDIEILVSNYTERNEYVTLDLGIMTEESNEMSDASGQAPAERVTFPKGETSAMVTKDIPAEGSVDFVFSAKKGQKLGIEIGYDFKDSDLKGFLTEPGLQDISLTMGPKVRKVFVVKKAGDHRLTVNNTSRKTTTFTLYLDVE